jgi:hypothetical protein
LKRREGPLWRTPTTQYRDRVPFPRHLIPLQQQAKALSQPINGQRDHASPASGQKLLTEHDPDPEHLNSQSSFLVRSLVQLDYRDISPKKIQT